MAKKQEKASYQGDPGDEHVEKVQVMETPKPKKAAPITSDIIKVPSAEELKNGAKIEVIKKDKVDEYIKKNNDSPTPTSEK